LWSYQLNIEQAQSSVLMRLKGITNSLALQVDGDQHARLMARYGAKDAIMHSDQDSAYLALHTVLSKNHTANMLKSPVYTVVFDSTEQAYMFGVTSAQQPYFRHVYRSFPTTLMEKQAEGAMIPMYEDEFGMWLSAFSVVKDRSGKVVALVQADEPFEVFIKSARSMALKHILLSLLVSGFFLLVLLRLLQPILKREQADKVALAQANEQILALDQFRKEMIANLSHDLRTPIAVMMGFSDALLQKKEFLTEAEQEGYLKIIATETRRINAMIGDLFDLSKLEAGQIVLQKEHFNLAEIAQDVLFSCQEQAKGRRIRLLTDFEDGLPLLHADISLIDRVLQNLLTNAFKYVDEGGLIKFTIYTEADKMHLKVCNSGQPIEEAHLPQIFDRYFKSSNRSKDSTGLGLAITKKIIDLHEGAIWAEVNDNITTFRFFLPVILS
jgi:signal transduction histidine kinase